MRLLPSSPRGRGPSLVATRNALIASGRSASMLQVAPPAVACIAAATVVTIGASAAYAPAANCTTDITGETMQVRANNGPPEPVGRQSRPAARNGDVNVPQTVTAPPPAERRSERIPRQAKVSGSHASFRPGAAW